MSVKSTTLCLSVLAGFFLFSCGGLAEGGNAPLEENPSVELPESFSTTSYWDANPDIQNGISRDDSLTLVQHWDDYGRSEGRPYVVAPSSSLSPISSQTSSSLLLSSQTGSSSSATLGSSESPVSSSFVPPAELPADFAVAEYCFLYPDLRAAFSISTLESCTQLNVSQISALENHYLSSGAADGRLYSLKNQCPNRAEGIGGIPCDFNHFVYSRQAAPSLACGGYQSAAEKKCLENHWLSTGKDAELDYTDVPTWFSVSGYWNNNLASLAPYYAAAGNSILDDQVLMWHWSFAGNALGWDYSESSSSSSQGTSSWTPITTEPAFKIVGFSMGGGIPAKGYSRYMTHLNLFGYEPEPSGSLPPSTKYHNFTTQSADFSTVDTRIMFTLGGAGKSANFSSVLGNSASRQALVDSITSYCVRNGFYGVDLDWEFPNSSTDKNNFDSFISALRTAFNPHSLKISIDVHQATNNYNSTTLSNVDWVNVMCYDGYNNWYPFSDHATWSEFTGCENTWAARLPKSKLVIGIPFYSRTPGADITTAYSSIPSPESCNIGANVCTYNGQNYNSRDLIERKVRSLQDGGYAGAMFWAIEHDFSSSPANSLLKTIADEASYAP